LALVVVGTKNEYVDLLFTLVNNVVNVVGGSCKRNDILQMTQAINIMKALESGKLSSGLGLNQETNLKRAGDIRWGSHYNTLISLIAISLMSLMCLSLLRRIGGLTKGLKHIDR